MFVRDYFVFHAVSNIILAVRQTRGEGDSSLRDYFFYENNTATNFAASLATDVEAQIHFLEFRVKWNRDLAPEVRFAKAEANEANVGFASERIKRGSLGHERKQHVRVDGVI